MKEIITNAKRNKGKIKDSVTFRKMWKFYKEQYPLSEIKDYKTFAKVIKTCNLEILNLVAEEAGVFKMPYSLGRLCVSKIIRNYKKPMNKWAINYQESKKAGFPIYYDQDYIYKWVWKKHYSNKKLGQYKFIASRKAKRLIPHILKTTKKDYFFN